LICSKRAAMAFISSRAFSSFQDHARIADSQVPRILWDYGRGLSGLANTLTPRSTGYAAADTTHSAHEGAGSG
jgi:hypothetical protein